MCWVYGYVFVCARANVRVMLMVTCMFVYKYVCARVCVCVVSMVMRVYTCASVCVYVCVSALASQRAVGHRAVAERHHCGHAAKVCV